MQADPFATNFSTFDWVLIILYPMISLCLSGFVWFNQTGGTVMSEKEFILPGNQETLPIFTGKILPTF